jgi:hypothetical protein
VHKRWLVGKPVMVSIDTQTCRASGCRTQLNSSPPRKSRHTCCKNLTHGEATIARSTDFTPTPRTANAQSRLTRVRHPAATPASAAGPVPSSNATKPARVYSLPVTSAWNTFSSSAKLF